MEKSRHYKKGETPSYYSKQDVKEIDFLLSNGRVDAALVKCEKYIEDYPKDDLGPFYLAKVYLKMGRKEECLELLSRVYYTRNFYNISAKSTAAIIYSDVLTANDKYDEAIDILEERIDSDFEFKSDRIRIHYLSVLINAGQFGKALVEVNKYLKVKNNPAFVFKKGYINYSLGNFYEAIDSFKKLSDNTADGIYQQKYYYIGSSYYALNKIERNDEYLNIAGECLRKALSIKNNFYYCACAKLACINISQNDLIDAEKFALVFLDDVESGKYSIKRIDDVYDVLAKVYSMQGKLDKALEFIDKIKNDYDRSSAYLRYYLNLKQFDKYIENANYVLSNAPESTIHVYLQEYISVLIRLGKLAEAEYMLNWLENEIPDPITERIKAYIRKEKGEEPLDYKYYSSKQIADYSLDEAVKHVCEGHLDCDYRPNFACEEDAREALLAAQATLDGLDYTPTGLFNRYILVKDGVGQDKFGKVHGMEAIVIPNTKNIITLYPITKCMSDYEDEFVPKKVKRLSQIEKFNQKYNKN